MWVGHSCPTPLLLPLRPLRVPHPSRVLGERVGPLTSDSSSPRVPHFSRLLREVGLLLSNFSPAMDVAHPAELMLLARLQSAPEPRSRNPPQTLPWQTAIPARPELRPQLQSPPPAP